MSQFKLIRENGTLIPGGYQFRDPITGKQYLDTHTLFPARVRQIINDRKANARLWTNQALVDPIHVGTELSVQNCTRLKRNPLFCTDGLPRVNQAPAQSFTPALAPAGKVCRFCGGQKLEEILCQVCSGKKIVGYRCLNCFKENKR